MKTNKVHIFLRELAVDFRWSQVFALVCLMGLSVLFVFSATYHSGGAISDEVKKQCAWFGLGLMGYLLAAMLDYHWLCRKSWFFYVMGLASLLLVLKFGQVVNNSKSWIAVAGYQVQPSEFAKLALLLALCQYFSKQADSLHDWRGIAFATAMAAAPVGLILKQPDLGTALVVIALFFVLIFLAGAPLKFFAVLSVLGLLGIAVVGYETNRFMAFREARLAGRTPAGIKFQSFLRLKEYQFNRILGVVAPDKLDRLLEGWNREQSLIAIGSGGLTGKGWTKGDVTHGGYLPRTVAPSDFIFAVFAEEAGFVGGCVLLILYAIILVGGIVITQRAGDLLGRLLAAGATFLIFFHIFVNMGMTLGILPIVGVPLPLMSYGGSFVLVCMIALGLVQSVWLHRKPY
ncbi:MAG: rod shape-determining protein RodA [Verrucomicrobia bacterium]|nr:rod shape-determining protein RodA [Verrucomicrobiota bacterium]